MKILFRFYGEWVFMAYENKTIEEVRDLIINSFQGKFNRVFRVLPKSFIRVLAVVMAGVFIVCYKQIGWLFLQLFPESSSWKAVHVLGMRIRPLVKWGVLIGEGDPRGGSQWRGTIEVIITAPGATLVAGSQLKSDITGKLYVTETSVALEEETATAQIICSETGTAGNLDIGDTLSFVSPLGTVQKVATVKKVIAYAKDDEIETDYRARVVKRFRSPPMGGALADYQKWAADVTGVLNAYPQQDTENPAGVLLYVAGIVSLFPNRIPDADLLRQVGDAITYDPESGKANRKPLTAIIDPQSDGTYTNIKPVIIVYFDVRIEGVTGVPVDDFKESVRLALGYYFLSREPYIRGLSDDNNKTNIVSKNNVASVVDQTSVSMKAEFGTVVLYHTGDSKNGYRARAWDTWKWGDDKWGLPNGAHTATLGYDLKIGELAKLDRLYVNEDVINE
jgi:hypothetical protein